MTMKAGDKATVWHEGSQSFYEATIIRPMSKRAVMLETKAASGDDMRPDGTIFQDALRMALNNMRDKWTYYNDISADKTTRRLKAAFVFPTDEQLKKLETEMKRQFGERFIKCGVTREVQTTGRYGGTSGGEFFVKLTAY